MKSGNPPADDIAQAAHDLNNLCASILGFAALAAALAPPGTKQALYLDEIMGSGNRAVALAKRLAALAADLRPPTEG